MQQPIQKTESTLTATIAKKKKTATCTSLARANSVDALTTCTANCNTSIYKIGINKNSSDNSRKSEITTAKSTNNLFNSNILYMYNTKGSRRCNNKMQQKVQQQNIKQLYKNTINFAESTSTTGILKQNTIKTNTTTETENQLQTKQTTGTNAPSTMVCKAVLFRNKISAV